MALEQYAVQLTPDEREQLSRLIRSGKSSARIVARARILLKVLTLRTGCRNCYL